MSIGGPVISPAASPGNGDKYEKSACTSEYRISVELKFCNIEVSPGAIYRDNKFRRIIYAGERRAFAGFRKIGAHRDRKLRLFKSPVRYRARIPEHVRNRVSRSWRGNIFETRRFMREATSDWRVGNGARTINIFFCSLRIRMRYNAWAFFTEILLRDRSPLFYLVGFFIGFVDANQLLYRSA